jgi:putative nucleotidyltransferase with HDIG domain
MNPLTLQHFPPTGAALATILVIDDEPAVRRLIADILEYEGYACITEPNGERLIELLDSRPVDLVISDINLDIAALNGIELIELVRARDETIPVIIITGYPSIDRAVDAIKRGAQEFLVKPFDREVLLLQVNRALQERNLRLENARLRSEVDNATVIERLNRQLQDRVGELTRLYEISDGFHQVMDGESIFASIVQLAARVTLARRTSLVIVDPQHSRLRLRAAHGCALHDCADLPLDAGIPAHAIATRQPVLATQPLAPSDLRLHRTPDEADAPAAWLALPLVAGEEVLGAVVLTDKPGGAAFTRQDEHLMQSLVEKAGLKLENQALYEGIYANLVDTLNVLITTIEAKDPYTHDHSHRVTEYAIALARRLGLGPEQVEMLHFAGHLHDIGKIGVRDEILLKPERLDDAEFAEIRRHPEIGERIVAPLGLAEEERAIIRHHHERWDGAGYPDGLAGEAIPLLARVVAVSDAFDAMTSTRSYRQAMNLERVLKEMESCAGNQFDPHIVRVWVESIRTGQISLQIEAGP